LPLVLGDKAIGALVVHIAHSQQFTPQQIELAQALAHQVTLAVRLTQLAEEAKQVVLLEERNRMAREIHDTLAQALTSIIVRLQTASLILEAQEEVRTCIDAARELARQGLSEARRSIQALRPQPLENGDLSTALSQSLRQMTNSTTMHGKFQVLGSPRALPVTVEQELLRIAQEAIANACKHAGASEIQVELAFMPDRIQLSVQDNGQGFTQTAKATSNGFGLLSMQQRAQRLGGQLTIASQGKAPRC